MAHSRTGYHLYQAYLLRLWRETPDSPLRASLQPSDSDERHHFASLEALLVYLQSQGQAGEWPAPASSGVEDAAGTKQPEPDA
jgi:hypothetical protein